MNDALKEYVTITIALCISVLVALASAQGSLIAGEYPVLFICLFIAFTIQWIVFLPSFYFSTERFYDLTGSITYMIVILTALYHKSEFFGSRSDLRSLLITGFVIVWALRLGSFLFLRVLKDKEDRRFSEWKKNFHQFLRVWTLQGLWVFLTSVAAVTAISSREIIEPGLFFLFILNILNLLSIEKTFNIWLPNIPVVPKIKTLYFFIFKNPIKIFFYFFNLKIINKKLITI